MDRNPQGLQCFTTDTIGGLTSQVIRGASTFLGYVETYPATAKRDPSGERAATAEDLELWANEQLSLLKNKGASIEQLYWAASNLSNVGLDPIDAISFPVLFSNNQHVLMPFEAIFSVLQQTQIACLKSRRHNFAEVNIQPIVIDNLPTLRPASAGNLITVEMDGGRPKHPFSLLGCLDRLVRQRHRELEYEVKPLPIQSIFGPYDALLIRLKKT
jgi:hypothetical protein